MPPVRVASTCLSASQLKTSARRTPKGKQGGIQSLMDHLCQYADRPLSFILRYLRRRPYPHAIIFSCVLAAVGCAVSTQYGVKFLVDSLIDYGQTEHAWLAFFVL